MTVIDRGALIDAGEALKQMSDIKDALVSVTVYLYRQYYEYYPSYAGPQQQVELSGTPDSFTTERHQRDYGEPIHSMMMT